jgi:pSer/pThr/pTyr-binding forkhead associated (FHA) protein
MALTIVVLAGAGTKDGGELALSLDAPRIVIGRSEGCEVRLPDPSVSPRHASIRQRGAEYVLLDEASDNGTFLGRTRLPPRSPTPLRSGDRVRMGRVWLAVRIEPVVLRGPPSAAAKELALSLVARGLAAQGEDPTPRVTVVDGPDRGRTLLLTQPGRPYILGRAKDTDLPLEDPDASRRHVAVTRRGDQFSAQDLGSRAGAVLDGAPLPQFDTPWRPGQVLALCRDRLVCEHPAAEALAELERSPCEPLGPDELLEPPAEPEPEPRSSPPSSTSTLTPTPESASSVEVERALVDAGRARGSAAPASAASRGGGWGLTDAAVVLLALGVLALSIAGLVWLFGRG